MGDTHYLTADDVLALVEWVFPRVLGFQPPILRAQGRELLESGLTRAENMAYYGNADLITQAAALTNGIAFNHPFVDGNKRSAWTACIAFLELNGHPLDADNYFGLAQQLIAQHANTDRSSTDAELAAWLRARGRTYR